jgi:hypothetical protein
LLLEVRRCDFPRFANTPDIAHDTAAVALVMREDDQDG